MTLAYCPECLSPIQGTPAENVCPLCHQSIEDENAKSKALRMKQELALQIKESRSLLEGKTVTLTEVRNKLPLLREKTRQAESRLAELTDNTRTPRDSQIDQLLTQKGNLEGKLEFLHNQGKTVGVLLRLKAEKAKLASEVQNISLRIRTKRDKQKERLIRAMSSVQKHALYLLKCDLPTEEAFENAKSVEIDFAKNTFAVDGKNQFSASSVAYLKNCIHYGALFASLELDFLRYPRFILCDNMEDKGMQAPRSQNFQRSIVELAKGFQVEHQVIFTTSMIDPSLNNTPLCVGPEYSKENKSLRRT